MRGAVLAGEGRPSWRAEVTLLEEAGEGSPSPFPFLEVDPFLEEPPPLAEPPLAEPPLVDPFFEPFFELLLPPSRLKEPPSFPCRRSSISLEGDRFTWGEGEG